MGIIERVEGKGFTCSSFSSKLMPPLMDLALVARASRAIADRDASILCWSFLQDFILQQMDFHFSILLLIGVSADAANANRRAYSIDGAAGKLEVRYVP